MKPIRLAVLRCDGHAYWYGPLMTECDPLLLRRYCEPAHRWFTDPNTYSPTVLTAPRCLEFHITNIWDPQTERAERFRQVFLNTGRICRTVEEVTEGIDAAFIANCNGDGSDHREMAEPFLEKGIPLFVDKPFALELKDAKAMVALAEKTGTPMMSTSILSFIPDLSSIKAQMAEIGNVRLGIVSGPAASQAGFVHTFALAQAVFGTGVKAVECYGSRPLKYIELYYPNDCEVAILNRLGVDGMSVEIFGEARFPRPRSVRRYGIGDPSFTVGAYTIACLFRDMIRSRKPPIDYASMVEIIAMGEAARMAQREGRRVELRELA